MGWIRIRMDPDPELGKFRAGSGCGTRKIQSRIWIRNKSFRIHNTGLLHYSKLLHIFVNIFFSPTKRGTATHLFNYHC